MSRTDADCKTGFFASGVSRVHFMGVCGVGMAGVAYLLAKRGFSVTGCDGLVNAWAEPLRDAGVAVRQGHDPEHLDGAECLVVTPAVPPEQPELENAKALGLPVFRRGEVLAEMVSGCFSLAVCGTHGKTTTSCFLARMLQLFGAHPSWCIGGSTASLGFVAGEGAGGPLVVEADESDGTLALYHPAILVINNLDIDHLEHFKDVDDLHGCFRRAAAQTSCGVVACRDHREAWQAAQAAPTPPMGFGFSPFADLQAAKLRCDERGTVFELRYQGQCREVALKVPGRHNVLNALGAAAAAIRMGYTFERVASVLPQACEELPDRRFESVYTDDKREIRVVADYAHHPVELRRAVEMARLFKPKRLRAVFQPHRYSRTKALREEFPAAFAGVDEVVLLPVYAASEPPLAGGGLADLYQSFRNSGGCGAVMLARSVDEAFTHFTRTVQDGDFVLVAGAGNVIALAEQIREKWAGGLPPVAEPEVCGAVSWFRTGSTLPPREVSETELAAAAGSVVGMGSNSWFSDLTLGCSPLRVSAGAGERFRINASGEVVAHCGAPGGALLDWLEKAGFSGLEFMDSIPGTVGGWLAMNAGAHGGCVGDKIKWIRCLYPDGKFDTISHDQCGFSYRACAALRRAVALECGLSLFASVPEAIRKRRQEFREKRIPLAGLRCCGSVFRNPPGDSAGRLLDAAGCKGLRIGGAAVADFHANIIHTVDGATSSDVFALALMMRNRVRAAFGIELVPEICGLDFGGIE